MRRKKKDAKKERRRQKRRRKKRKVSIKVKDINKKDCKISNNENEKGKRAYREKICEERKEKERGKRAHIIRKRD